MRKQTILIVLAASLIFLNGCETLNSEENSSTTNNSFNETIENGSDGKTSIIASIMENGDYQYVDIKVDSVSVMKEKIEGLNTEPFKFIPDKYEVSDDGEILCDYSFVAVNLSLNSDTDTEVCLSGFRLETDANSVECYYNSNPIEVGNAKTSGYTNVIANIENKVTIGFFVDDEFLKSSSFTLIPLAVDTGDEPIKINIKNQQ